jgi:hypothetical protein
MTVPLREDRRHRGVRAPGSRGLRVPPPTFTPTFFPQFTLLPINLIVGIGPPGVRFFHTGVRRRKYKLGQTKQFLLPNSR